MQIKNLTKNLFKKVAVNDGSIKNIDIVDCYIINTYASGLFNGVKNEGNLKIINVNFIGGYIEGSAWACTYGSYISTACTIEFINCESSVSLVSASEVIGGFIAHQGNAKKILIDNSFFSGTMSSIKNPKRTEFQGNAYFFGQYNDKGILFLKYTEINLTKLRTMVEFVGVTEESVNDEIQIKGSINNITGSSKSGLFYNSLKSSELSFVRMTNLPNKHESFNIQKHQQSTHAKATLFVGFNGIDGGHNYTSNIMVEDLTLVDGSYTTNDIKYYDIKLNTSNQSGPNSDGTYYYNNSFYTGALTSYECKIIEYNAAGSIVRVTTFDLLP